MEYRKKIDLSPLMAECRKRMRRVGISTDDLRQNLRQTTIENQHLGREKIFMRRRLKDIAEEDSLSIYLQLKEDLAQSVIDFNVDEYLAIAQQVLNEIKSDDIEYEEECEDHCQFLNNHIICPVCLQLPASVNLQGNLVCQCGLDFPLPHQMELGDVEYLLELHSSSHSNHCSSVPNIYEVRHDCSSNLVLTCQRCLFSSIVLHSRDGSADTEMN